MNFKKVSWDLRNKKGADRFSNLEIHVLLTLHGSTPLLRAHIIKALKSNYYDIEKALKLLQVKNLISNEEVFQNRINNSITVRTREYRLSLAGELFVNELFDRIANQ
ncbi:MAG: hypothetical protein H7069_05940 [Phormidesmis sp. FL-bin-119]|nr:hypothetical protein [Pedobacter sp.]